jgi:hypothetical protein
MTEGTGVRAFDLGTGGLRAALEARRAGQPVPGATPDPAFREKVVKAFAFAQEVKRELAARGATEGEFTCPHCKAGVRAAVIGPKRHLRLACATPGCLTVVE